MKKLALIGHNISYSLSPFIHGEIFARTGVKASYELISLSAEELPTAVERLKTYDGFNITKPHKQNILPYLTDCELKSVNTVKISDGKMYGYSTDAYGFIKDVELQFGKIYGKALVLGAGGVAGVIAKALKDNGLDVYIWNRTKEKADEMARLYGLKSVNREDIAPDFIVNCTSFGFNRGENPMADKNGKLAVDISKVKWAYDTIYSPPETDFLQSFSCKKANGWGMLILQAVEADRIMLGLDVSEEKEKEIYFDIMKKLAKERK